MAKKNYSKMSTDKVKSDPVVETSSLDVEQTVEVVDEPVVETPVKKGVVVNCVQLNVRNNPHPNAAIELVIKQGTEVDIIDSNGDFYHVRKGTTTEGFDGWCMKKYISVK